MDRPMPREAPVTNAVLPAKSAMENPPDDELMIGIVP
jgi:hypothetical protein